jgi:hypothetical protein
MTFGAPSVETRNQLLKALPPEVASRLLARMRPVSLTIRDSLMMPDVAVEAVYFVESGFVSLVTRWRTAPRRRWA